MRRLLVAKIADITAFYILLDEPQVDACLDVPSDLRVYIGSQTEPLRVHAHKIPVIIRIPEREIISGIIRTAADPDIEVPDMRIAVDNCLLPVIAR